MSEVQTDRFLVSVCNYEKSLNNLKTSCASPITEARDRSGIIKDFELTYELAWKTLKKFLEREGHEVKSARDAIGQAYQLNYIQHEQIWLNIIKDRNLTVHTYDEAFAIQMINRIMNDYLQVFNDLKGVFDKEGLPMPNKLENN